MTDEFQNYALNFMIAENEGNAKTVRAAAIALRGIAKTLRMTIEVSIPSDGGEFCRKRADEAEALAATIERFLFG